MVFVVALNLVDIGSNVDTEIESIPYYITILNLELTRRKLANPCYSMRAFSRFLKVDPSALSRILNGKCEISIPICIKVLEKLNLTDEQKRHFVESVANAKMAIVISQLAGETLRGPEQITLVASEHSGIPQTTLVPAERNDQDDDQL